MWNLEFGLRLRRAMISVVGFRLACSLKATLCYPCILEGGS
jgi:hypothetical protein